RLQAPKEELTQKCVEQQEISVTNKSAENKEEYIAAVYQSNVQHNDGAAEVYSEVHFAEQPAANTTAENKGEHAGATVGQSNIEHNEVKVSADAHVEDTVAEIFAAAGTEESKDTAEVPAGPALKLKSQEEPSNKTEPANAVVETAVQPAEGSCEKSSPEQAADDSVKAVAEVVAKSTSDTSDVVNATLGNEAALPDGVKAVAEVVVKSSPKTSDVVNATPGKEAALPDGVKAVAEVVVKSSSGISDVVNATPRKEAALPDGVKAVAEVVAKSSSGISDVVNVTPKKEAALSDGVKAVAEVVVNSLPKTSDVVNATPGEEAALQVSVEPVPDLLAESVSELSTQPAAKTATKKSCEKGVPEQAAGESVEAVAKVVVESSPDTPAVTGGSGEEAALQVNVEPVPDLVAGNVPESPTQPAAETSVKSLESKVESAAKAEEVVEFEVAPVVNTFVKQSVKPTPKRAADGVVELNIKDAVEPVTAVQEKFSYTPIELSEALDVKPPTTETAPKPLKDSKQSHTEETKPNQRSEHTNTSEIFKKSKEKEQPTQKQNVIRIDGNVKLLLSEPAVICHPDCLK
ncbi:hypothetical protein FQN60_000937, partial [Etheostoma spectabile]